MKTKNFLASVILSGLAALLSPASQAQTCNLSATDGGCAEAAAPAVLSAASPHGAGAGYHPVNLAAKAAGDPMASFSAGQVGAASGAQSAAPADGFALSLPFGAQAAPDSPFAWLFALGFLAVIVLRRTRPGAFNLNG